MVCVLSFFFLVEDHTFYVNSSIVLLFAVSVDCRPIVQGRIGGYLLLFLVYGS